MLGVIAVAVGQVGVGGHERQRRVAGHLLVGEVTEPAANGRVVALRDVPEGVGPQQIAGEPDVSRGRGMADRRIDVAVVGVPVARAPVELRLELGLAPAQLRAQHLGQEPVVAVPLVGAIQGDDQGVGPREVPQPLGRARLQQHGVAQRPREPVEHRRALQEGDLLGRELGQQAVGHVVGHDAIVAAEPRDRGGGVRLIAQRHGGEIEPGRPTLRAAHERVDVRSGQVGPGEPEQRGRLAPGHDEVARRQLEHLAMRPQAPEGQRRLASRGQHELRARRRILDERRKDVDRPARAQDLDVVQDEDEIAAATGQWIRGARHGRAKVLGIVIGAMQGDPRERALIVLRPLQQRGRLAIAGRRHQEGEGHVVDLRQPPHEAGARDEALAERGVRARRGQHRQARCGAEGDGVRGHEVPLGRAQHRRRAASLTRAHATLFGGVGTHGRTHTPGPVSAAARCR